MIIADISVNHNGSLATAKQLAIEAKEAGVDVVKLQFRDLDTCLTQEQKDAPKFWHDSMITYLEYKQELELSDGQILHFDNFCRANQIVWTASVYDIPSLNKLLQYQVPFVKLPSSQITNEPLLKALAKCRTKTIISTGGSTEQEMKHAMVILGEQLMGVMMCTSIYPTPDNKMNLNRIKEFKRKYDYTMCGYSSHHKSPYAVFAAASEHRADMVEFHITEDKKQEGSDHNFSLELDEVAPLCEAIKKNDLWRGSYIQFVYDEELEKIKSQVH